ncbi:MAG: cbb3-type cytochrome c oxidase subunit 3 [Methylotenera sp.]
MDINTLRIVATVASFIAFIGIIVWVWRNRNTPDFKEAANLPFKDDQN